MNKNIIKLFAILMMCFMLVSVLVACSEPANNNEVVVKDGEDGQDGKDGLTPFIKDGYWWIGETNTGVKAEGQDGDAMRCEQHDWDEEYIVIREHTQDAIGLLLKVCLDCDGAEILRVNHEYEAVVTAPTCTTTGYTTYTCACGKTYTDDETEKVPHVWGDWEDSLYDEGIDLCECERPTIQVRFCEVCGTKDAEENIIPAAGHKFLDENWEPSINKTDISPCEQAPLLVNYCAVCNHKECNKTIVDPEFDGVIPNHAWGNWTVVTEPTADAEGLIKKVCSKCGDSYTSGVETKPLPKLDKVNYTYAVVTAPECDVAGEDSYTYVIDGQNIVITVPVDALGHEYTNSTEITNLVAPTLTTPGSVTVGCVNEGCDHTETVEIPAVGSVMYGRYITKMGNCLAPMDTYEMPIDVNGDRVIVTFEVKGNYEHDEEPAASELVELEGEGKIYLAYWCTKCNHWIIVDWRNA